MKKHAKTLRSLDATELATVSGGLDMRQHHRGNFQKTTYHWVSPGSVWTELSLIATRS